MHHNKKNIIQAIKNITEYDMNRAHIDHLFNTYIDHMTQKSILTWPQNIKWINNINNELLRLKIKNFLDNEIHDNRKNDDSKI